MATTTSSASGVVPNNDNDNKNDMMMMVDSSSVDVSLLRGLEPVMTLQEQAQLTALLTSGDPQMLAQAAKIFYEFSRMLDQQQQVTANKRTVEQHARITESFRSSGFGAVGTKNRPGFNDYEVRVAEEKKQADHDKKLGSRNLPLPVRMPRFVVLEAFDPDGTPVERRKVLPVCSGETKTKILKPSLTFVECEGDGTLGMAFKKLTVQSDIKGSGPFKKLAASHHETSWSRPDSTGQMVHVNLAPVHPSPGYDAIVDRAGGYDARLLPMDDTFSSATVVEPMVLIANTYNDATKLGLHRGDVVTHINGQEFVGTSAQDLNMLIKAHYARAASSSDDDPLEIVVNAELCIAQALKLRSMVQ